MFPNGGAPVPYPLAPGRPRWRFTLHERDFTGSKGADTTLIAELVDARSRRVERSQSTAGQLGFTLDARLAVAARVAELQTEVCAWRYDEYSGREVCVLRGVVTNSQDTVSEQTATCQFTATDSFGMLGRRLLTWPMAFEATDQDQIVADLVERARAVTSSSPPAVSFAPGSWLSLDVDRVNPNGTPRPPSGQQRVRAYNTNQVIADAISDLAGVAGGFDFEVQPGYATDRSRDRLRIFYPYQGIVRDDCAMIYGTTVASFTRTVNSSNYANYVRTVGNQGSENVDAPYGEAWAAEANQTGLYPIGLWMTADSASDVSDLDTLAAKAAGRVEEMSAAQFVDGQLRVLPSYSLQLRPGAYRWGFPNLGDEVPLIVRAGRLNESTYLRVQSISYAIGDDGDENIELGVGRPPVTFADLYTRHDRAVAQLVRRSGGTIPGDGGGAAPAMAPLASVVYHPPDRVPVFHRQEAPQ